MKTLSKEEYLNMRISGSSLKCYLNNICYAELESLLGPPTMHSNDFPDGKVNYEWVIEYNNKLFFIYDWKTINSNFSKKVLDVWNVGSTESLNIVSEFITHFQNLRNVSR